MESSWYVIKGGVVVNFIVATQAFVTDHVLPYYDLAVDIKTLSAPYPDIGWTYNAGVFTPPQGG